MPLERHVTQRLAPVAAQNGPEDDQRVRRRAIAYLLLYLADGKADFAREERRSRAAARTEARPAREPLLVPLRARARRARARPPARLRRATCSTSGSTSIVPLETPYETLKTLSLDGGAELGLRDGAAVPLRERRAAGADPEPGGAASTAASTRSAAIVRLLADGRVGAHPDVIPLAASSQDYLDRVVERLDGPESDAGSLTFTLALFEAAKLHDIGARPARDRGPRRTRR